MVDFIKFTLSLGAIWTLYQFIIKIFNKNVSEERIKWRERMRVIAKFIYSYDYDLDAKDNNSSKKNAKKLLAELALRLNLFDSNNDIKIFNLAKMIIDGNGKNEEYKKEFIARVSLLLKHDWERSKYESSLRYFLLPFLFEAPKSPNLNSSKLDEFFMDNREDNKKENDENQLFKNEDLKKNFLKHKELYKNKVAISWYIVVLAIIAELILMLSPSISFIVDKITNWINNFIVNMWR